VWLVKVGRGKARLSRCGMVWQGSDWFGRERRRRLGTVRSGSVRHGIAGKAGRDKARLGKAG